MILVYFIILFIFFSALPYFIAELMLYTIQPGRIFGFYSKWVGQIKNEFWYNSLGGCAVCFTQRISEMTYFLFINLFTGAYGGWVTCRMPLPLSIALNIILFIGFASIPYFLRQGKKKEEVKHDIDEQKPKPFINNN